MASVASDERQIRIGGSEVGALFGAHDWLDEFGLWARKKQPHNAPPRPPSPRMLWGQFVEPALVRFYAYLTGRNAEYWNKPITDPARPYMIYTPDALVRGERRGVEAKIIAWDQRHKFGEGPQDIPEGYQLQCWYYMAGMDYDAWDLIAMIGDEPRLYTIHRDREVEASMLEYVAKWHERFILGDEHPPIGGSAAAHAYLQRAFPKHKRPDMRPATDQETVWLDALAQARIAQEYYTAERSRLEAQIKEAIAEREGLTFPRGKFTWRRCKDSVGTNWEPMALALLTSFVPEEERQALYKRYEVITEGSRRIRFSHDALKEAKEEQAA